MFVLLDNFNFHNCIATFVYRFFLLGFKMKIPRKLVLFSQQFYKLTTKVITR